MKRKAYFTMDDYGSYSFHPRPKGQEECLSTYARDSSPTIDNDEVVERYVKAKLEFEAAQEEVMKHLVYPSKTETPFSCASCLYYKNITEGCDICKVSNPDRTCNYYREDGYGT